MDSTGSLYTGCLSQIRSQVGFPAPAVMRIAVRAFELHGYRTFRHARFGSIHPAMAEQASIRQVAGYRPPSR